MFKGAVGKIKELLFEWNEKKNGIAIRQLLVIEMRSEIIHFGLTCAYLRISQCTYWKWWFIQCSDSTLHVNHMALNSLPNGGEK